MMATLTFICAAAASAADGVVTASSFGFDPEDSTEFLQKALDSGARRIVIDRRPAPWITRPLFVRSNCEVVFERGVEVVAKKGEFRGKNDSLFTLKRSENVKLSGYGATLRMHRADYAAAPYTKAEWRMSLNLLSCSNVVVEGFTLLESGGDGVYLGVTGEDHAPCRNVVLRDLVCDRQYRQGISVISARNLLIERCMLRGTGGTPPAAGIDFEPNRASEELSEIVMRDCIITNNHGAGIQFYLGQLNATSKPISVKIVNCLSTDNSRGFWLGHGRAHSHVRGGIACENCIIATRNAPAVHIPSQSDDAVSVTFEKCRLVDFQAKDSLLKGAPARRKFDPAAARPFDACPGKLVRMHPFRFRNGVTYRFYMATPGEARGQARIHRGAHRRQRLIQRHMRVNLPERHCRDALLVQREGSWLLHDDRRCRQPRLRPFGDFRAHCGGAAQGVSIHLLHAGHALHPRRFQRVLRRRGLRRRFRTRAREARGSVGEDAMGLRRCR